MSGALIREARLRAGLTQAELAGRLGVPQSTVARWEGRKARPSLEAVHDALRACGLDLRVRLIPHDASLSILIDRHLQMTPAERLAQNSHMVDFVEGARARMAAARGD